MRYYIIAGESSGDMHGSGLMKALKDADPEAEFRIRGGDLMQAEGGTLVQHISETSYMGFWEVIRNIGRVITSMRLCRKDLLEYMPDALILIDYPGFNLRMARFGHGLGIRVFYYISPKIWAWNQSRIKIIKKYVDHMLTIFPFEAGFYERFGYRVDYVGNPLVDAIDSRQFKEESFDAFNSRNRLSGKPLIAILPGSRIQEINKSLPLMLSVTDNYPGYQFVIAGAPSVSPEVYLKYTGNNVPLLYGQTYPILSHSEAAMVVSGTATLEAALLGTPIVVCYRGSYLSYLIARRLVKVEYISLVNLIMERKVVTELIQNEFNSVNLRLELDKLLAGGSTRKKMADDMKYLKEMLGGPGASVKAAEKVVGYLIEGNK